MLNSLAGQSAVADWVYIFIAEYLPHIVLAAVFILILIWRKTWLEKFRVLMVFLITVGISYGIVYTVFPALWPRLRPFEGLAGVTKLIQETGLSFPSKHAAFFFLIAAFVFYFNRKAGRWFFIPATLIGIGRIIVGIHYPFDIFAGAIFGTLMGWFGVAAARRFKIL
jgi:undecaprenyl-diphosphatase